MNLVQGRLREMNLPVKKEYMGLTGLLAVFMLFPAVVRMVDTTAAPIDAGALSAVLMAALAFVLFKSLTWWLIKSIWPVFAGYAEACFDSDFMGLEAGRRVLIFMGFYLCLLLGFVLTLQAII